MEIKSYEQILGAMIRSLQSSTGLNDLNPGSVLVSLVEACAESDFSIAADLLSALDAIDLERAEGPILDLVAAQRGIERYSATRSSGAVTIIDTGFDKLSTTIYQGTPAPIVNSTVVYVNDAANWPTTGKVYLGRGTVNVEGPISYTAITAVGSYYQLTLASATGKPHNTGETVILSQGGNRLIPGGSTLNTGVVGASSTISFTLTNAVTILDGEDTLEGVAVICSELGTSGNVPANAITEFPNPPAANLAVVNELPFTNARDQEGDIDLRDRVKKKNSTNSNGTGQSILNAVTNLVALDEQKRILSASLIEATGNNPSVLYIDDGAGYEPIFDGIGQEIIVDNSVGGQQYLQLVNAGLVKAQITCGSTQPFALSNGSKLAVLVGGEWSEHTFATDDFVDINNATAYEVVASINGNSDLLFVARTAGGATKVVLSAKADVGEDIEIATPTSGTDANDIFDFQTGRQYTLKLYKNDDLLTKDGSSATLESADFPWGLSSASYTLTIGVDGTPAATHTFSASDLAPYSPSTAPLTAWVAAINAKIPGVTADVLGNRLQITSNKGTSDSASLAISGGTLVTTGAVFANESVTGNFSDYSLVRGTGQIILSEESSEGDTFKAGTTNTRAYVETDAISSGAVNASSTGNIFILNDADASIVTTGAVAGVAVTVAAAGTNIWKYSAAATTFANVAIGQWVIIWDSGVTDSNNRGYFRVSDTDSSTYICVEKAAGTAASYTLLNDHGFQFISTNGIVQDYMPPSPTNQSILQWAADLNNNKLIGINASVADTNRIRLTTNTFNEDNGSISLLNADVGGQLFDFTIEDEDVSTTSHIGFVETDNSELGSPLFLNPLVSITNNTATGTKVFVANTSNTINPDKMLGFLKTFNTSITNRFGNNRFNWDGIRNIVNGSATINLVNKLTVKDRLENDRAYLAKSFDLAGADNLFLVFDNSPVEKSVALNTYRTLAIKSSPSPTVNSFSATDIDGGTVELTSSFGSAFDFSNYKLWSRARAVVDCDGTNNGFIVRSSNYGPNGNAYRFFLGYPYGPNTSLSYSLNAGNTVGGVDVTTILSSGPTRTPTYTGSTSFTVSYSAPTATFFWNGGTTPTFVSDGVLVGDIANIGVNSGFTSGNQGIFRVTNVTQTTFQVSNHNASATSQSVVVTINNVANLTFYPISTTCNANNVISFINSSLNSYLTASLGAGEDGTGLVNRSITDFTGATQNYVSLVDGENWVNNATLTASPQFTTEANFTLSSSLYSLVGERVRLIPRTAKQIVNFLASPAVSGIDNLGEIRESSQGGKVQIASDIVGSQGAIKIDGGSANSLGGSIVGSSLPVGSPVAYELVRTTSGASNGAFPGSWLQFTSGLPLSKNIGLSNGSLAAVTLPSTLEISGPNLYTTKTYSGDNTTRIQVEQQGAFACYIYTGVGTAPAFSNVLQGDWVVISSTANFNASNAGKFRVVRATSVAFWVENDSAVEQDIILSANSDLVFYSSDSVLAGDSVVLSGGVLGSNNDGTYTVASVSSVTSLLVNSTFQSTVSLTTLNNNKFNNLNFFNPDVSNFYRPVVAIASPSVSNTNFDDIVIGDYISQLSGKISDTFEFTFEGMNKLGFPTTTNFGIDGYSYYQGLVGEATKVIYGDSENSTIYPGIKASPAYIDIRPPLPKRITISIGVRLKTGIKLLDIENTIKSTVSSVINSTLIGQSIALSDIINAVTSVDGVFAASIISPQYSSSNDVIAVKTEEKPLIISQNDITISLLGN